MTSASRENNLASDGPTLSGVCTAEADNIIKARQKAENNLASDGPTSSKVCTAQAENIEKSRQKAAEIRDNEKKARDAAQDAKKDEHVVENIIKEWISTRKHLIELLEEQLLNSLKNVGNGALRMKVEDVSCIPKATIAVLSEKDDKIDGRVTVTFGKDYPQTKPSIDILPKTKPSKVYVDHGQIHACIEQIWSFSELPDGIQKKVKEDLEQKARTTKQLTK